MDAKERIRVAREATAPIAKRTPKALDRAAEAAEPRRGQRSAPPSPEPSPPARAEALTGPTPESPNWTELRQEVAALQVAIQRSRREVSQNLWTVGIACTLLALGVVTIERATAPRPSLEDQRLQRLGADIEERWQTMTEKERRQVEKIIGWTRSTERRAQ